MVGMIDSVTQTVAERLATYQQNGLQRQLRSANALIDFCSNDYLGFARSVELKLAIQQAWADHSTARNGATGSRLLAGQTLLANDVEVELATFYQTESALIFNSGYDANVGLLACLPRTGDILLTDELIHASMIDGARLSYAARYRFRHNDLDDLEAKLKEACRTLKNGQVFVAVESVYSMDGDVAPLRELVALCEYYGAALVVDEAHATGLYGPNGQGLVVALGLQDRVFARIHTFGKALGVHGAAVVGPAILREYLINFARTFIYTTALPPHSLVAIQCAHAHRRNNAEVSNQLNSRVGYFRKCVVNLCLILPGPIVIRQFSVWFYPVMNGPGLWLTNPSTPVSMCGLS